MPSIPIPPESTRRWSGPYLGNYYGVLWQTHNIDLDKSEGKLALARRLERIEDTISDFTGNTVYNAFLRTNADCTDRYWALADTGGLQKTDSTTPENATSPSDSWDTDALSNTPQTAKDFTVGGNDSRNDSGRNKLFVTTDSGDIAVLNDTGNNAWTASWWISKQAQPALTQNVRTRPIDYFPFEDITLIGSGNMIHTVPAPSTDTVNDTVSYNRITIPKDLNARHIFHTANREWILTDHKRGGRGKIVEWDGSSERYNNIHDVYGVAALSGVDYYGTPIVLNDRGVFLEFSGVSFQPMVRSGQQIAFPISPGASLVSGVDTSLAVAVAPRGMTVGEDGLVYINVDAMPSGVLKNERFTGGIWCLNPLTGQLYNKYALGRWGDSVDFGQQWLSKAGAIEWIPTSITSRNLLAGGIVNTTATAGEQTGIWLLEAETSVLGTRGYFITQYIPSSEVEDQWDSLWVKFKRFMTVGSQIIVKARGTRSLVLANRRPLLGTITWTSTTTFTLTLSASDDALAVGDEVEVMNGVNAGYLAHITTISGNHGASQTITIDETVTTGSSTSIARFERWKKLGVISNTSKYEDTLNVGINSSFVQLKVELRGLASEQEVSEMVLNFNTNLKNQK